MQSINIKQIKISINIKDTINEYMNKYNIIIDLSSFVDDYVITGKLRRTDQIMGVIMGANEQPISFYDFLKQYPIKVERVVGTDLFTIIDGRHRMTRAIIEGLKNIPVQVIENVSFVTTRHVEKWKRASYK